MTKWQKHLSKHLQMSDQPREFKVTRLPRNGPKPGQSLNSYLYGRSLGDKKWERRKGDNINKLINTNKPRNKEQ